MLPGRPAVLSSLLSLLLPLASLAQAPPPASVTVPPTVSATPAAPSAGCAPSSLADSCAASPSCPSPCFYFQADYLLWWFKQGRVDAPLLVTSDGVPEAGGPFVTRTLFGNQEFGNTDPRSGLRLRAAYVAESGVGLEMSGFLMERAVSAYRVDPASTLSTMLLARPFIEAGTGQEGLTLLNFEDALAGSAAVTSYTKLWGAEANLTRRTSFGPVEAVFAGYRFLALREQLAINDRITVQSGGVGFFDSVPVDEQDTRVRTDRFTTRNNFHGANFGLVSAVRDGVFDVTLRSSIALGVTQQRLDVAGQSTYQPNDPNTANPLGGSPRTLPGGLLALPSNIGTRSRTQFAVLPELDLSVGCQVVSWLRVAVGYNFLYCSSVVRPGDQIDPAISLVQVPTNPTFDPTVAGTSPRPTFQRGDFWAHGLNFSMLFSF